MNSYNALLRVISSLKIILFSECTKQTSKKVKILARFLYWMAPLDLLVYLSVIEYLNYDPRSGHDTHKDQKIHLRIFDSG